MINKNIAIPQDKVGKVCMHCLGEFDDIKPIKIGNMGYGSIFDNTTTQIDLCDACKGLNPKEWWGLKEIPTDVGWGGDDDYVFYEIEFENEIWAFMNSCPNAGKELFFNRYDREHYMEPQDWIDYELKILPHEKCKKYGRYSHEEISAYQDRFPRCNNVFLKIYSDNSKSTECKIHYHVSGNADGSCGQTCTDCYQCESFKLREDGSDIPIVNVTEEFYAREKERTEEAIKNFKEYLKKLNNREIDPEEIY